MCNRNITYEGSYGEEFQGDGEVDKPPGADDSQMTVFMEVIPACLKRRERNYIISLVLSLKAHQIHREQLDPSLLPHRVPVFRAARDWG